MSQGKNLSVYNKSKEERRESLRCETLVFHWEDKEGRCTNIPGVCHETC